MLLARIEVEGVVQAFFFIVVILGSIFGPLIERWAKRKKKQQAGRAAEAEVDVEEIEIHEEEPEPAYSPTAVPAPRSGSTELAEVLGEGGSYVEPPPVVLRDIEIVEAPPRRPLPPPAVPLRVAKEVEHTTVTSEEYISFDERVLKGREQPPLAMAVIYSEILQPCRARRPFPKRA